MARNYRARVADGWRWVIAAALIVACVDGPTSPGRYGELRIRPSYQTGDDPETLGFGVDSAKVRIVRTSDAAAPLVDSMVVYESDTASLGWIVDLRAQEETLKVEVSIWDDGARLYSGDHMVPVRDGSIGNAAADVLVAYVGPPIVATVTVSPTTVTFDAFGATSTLAAEARDRHGDVVNTAPTWTSVDATVASVDPVSGLVRAAGNGTTTVRAAAGPAIGTATIVVAQHVAAITITPAPVILNAIGATRQLVAAAVDRNGFAVAGAPIAWASSDAAVVSVNPETGEIRAVRGGSATIRATSSGVEGTLLVTVNPTADIASIVVSPPSATLTTVGATREFTAEARDANGSVLTGVSFTWSSSAPGAATVDAATGVATAVAHGVSDITATAGAVAANATLTVDLGASIATILVSPATVTLTAMGATRQFTAEARDAAGTVVPVTAFEWSSSSSEVATVDAVTGLATAVAHGSTSVRARVGGVSGSGALSVNLTTVVASVIVTPSVSTLTSVGATQQFTAEARDGNGAAVPGISFEWTSSVPAVATIAANTGLATAAGHGSTTITASANGVTGTATLAVDLIETDFIVVVSPAAATLATLGATQQFTAEARDGTGAVLPGVPFVWSSNAPAAATVNGSGMATATGHGSAIITASAGARQGSATLTVDLTETVASIVVSPSTPTVTAVPTTVAFTAEARNASGAVIPGITFAWTSTVTSVASVEGNTGLATAVAHGSTAIAASANGVTGTATLTVNLTTSIATIVVSPGTITLTALGATQQFTAEARDAAGAVVPGVEFEWTSALPAVASVATNTGLATTTGHGTTTITASANGMAGTATLTVDLTATIATIVVSPATATLMATGTTQLFIAEARDAIGAVVPVATFAWSSSAPQVAIVDAASGLATAVGHGDATISATVNGVSGSAVLSVDLSTVVASVVITPGSASLTALGTTQQFTAEARDATGAVLPGVPFVWSSSTPEVATIDPATGLATAVANGSATVTATTGDVSGTAVLTVEQQIALVVVTPASATLTLPPFAPVGSPASASLIVPLPTQQFTAQAFDGNGRVVAGATFTWMSTNTDVATVDANGLATATGRGTTEIRATSGGIRGMAVLTVQ